VKEYVFFINIPVKLTFLNANIVDPEKIYDIVVFLMNTETEYSYL